MCDGDEVIELLLKACRCASIAALVRALGGSGDAFDAVWMGDPVPEPSVLSISIGCPGERRIRGLWGCGCGCIMDGNPYVLSDIDRNWSAMVSY
jgi:hypothetical protein